jgi:hypothetical protein
MDLLIISCNPKLQQNKCALGLCNVNRAESSRLTCATRSGHSYRELSLAPLFALMT